MLDIKQFETHPEQTKAALLRRGEIPGLDRVLEVSVLRKAAISALQKQQEKRNELNKAMKGGPPSEETRAQMKALSDAVKAGEAEVRAHEAELETLLLGIPNVPLDDVPQGADEDANVELSVVGTPRTFDFTPKDHTDLGEALGIMDFARAAKVSGSRFVFLKGLGARLSRAIAHFMLDFHTERGDTEFNPPLLVNEASMLGTGQLPKFKDDAFATGGDRLYLIPTAEVPLTNYFRDEILDEADLPIRVCAYSMCFRAEAGSAGKDTRGMIRQHQFEKVEMVRFAKPDQLQEELDAMVKRASDILTALELPHRTVLLCTGDLGFSAEKTVDIEVWLPGQDTYREISSCSSFGSYQARRAKIRYRPEGDQKAKKKPKPQVACTLNGSGLAVGRTLVALLENHQQADGSVRIPAALRPYMGGLEVIAPS